MTEWPKMHLTPTPHPAGEFCIRLGCSIEVTPENCAAPYVAAMLREFGIRELNNKELKTILLAAAVDNKRLKMMSTIIDISKES